MSTATVADRLHGRIADWVGRPLFWASLIVAIMSFPIIRALRIHLPPPLPVLGKVPDFSLSNQYGQPFGSKELAGKIWVANFIFTRCPTVCPLFTRKMAALQDRTRNMGPAFHLVSFSVDPEYDTPPRLLEYANHHKVSPRMWSFLTGDASTIRKTVVDGFKISMGHEGPDDDFMNIFHGTHFVLVDAQGRIRGYYASDDEERVEALIRDIGLLGNRGN